MAESKLSLVGRLRALNSQLGHDAANEILRLREELKESYKLGEESTQSESRWDAKQEDDYGPW